MIEATKADDLRWAEGMTGLKFHPPLAAVSFKRGDDVRAVAVFQNYTGTDIEVTIAARELPRSFLRAVRGYVVNQLHCRRATFKTRVTNICAIKAMARLNAICEGRQHKLYADGSDALIFAIHDEDFKHG